MKLVIAIVQREDSNNLQRAFVQNDFRGSEGRSCYQVAVVF